MVELADGGSHFTENRCEALAALMGGVFASLFRDGMQGN